MKTLTGAANCSLIDLLKRDHLTDPHPTLDVTYPEVVGAKANVFVSFAYKSNFIDLVGAIERFVENESVTLDPEKTFYWFDPVVNDQWTAIDKDFTWWATTFKDAICKINHTLMFMTPWRDPEPLTRAWCLFELFSTVSTGSKFSIAMSKYDADNFMNAMMTNGYADVIKMLATIDVRKSSCWNPDDQSKIFNVVREIGFDKINSLVFQLLRTWVVTTCTQAIAKESDTYQKCNLMNCLGTLLMNQGKFKEAEALFLDVAHNYEFTCGNRSVLIELYFRMGQYERAEVMQKEYLTAIEEEQGSSDAAIVNARVSIANMLMERQRFDDALNILKSCLSSSLEENETRKVNESLGILYMKMGLLDDSLVLQLEGLEYLRVKHGERWERHADAVAAMHNIAGVYSQLGKIKEALPLLQKCYEIYNETHGSEHPSTLLSLQGLANTHGLLGNFKVQAELLQKCYESQVVMYGESNHFSLDTKLSLARNAVNVGGFKHAIELFQSVLDAAKGCLDGNGADYKKLKAEASQGIGQAYAALGEYSQAHEAYYESLYLTRRTFGVNHPNSLRIMGDIVTLHIQRGEFLQGKTLAIHCLTMQHEALRKGHPDIIVVSVSLGTLHMELGEHQQALDLLTEVYVTAVETFGEKHDICGTIQGSIGRAYRLLGKYEKAENFMLLAIETLKQTVGPKHTDTLGVISALANLYNTYLRQFDKAKPIYMECLSLQAEVLGETHPDTLLTKANLASLYCNIGQYAEGKAMLEECLVIQRQTLGDHHPYTQVSVTNLNALAQIMHQ